MEDIEIVEETKSYENVDRFAKLIISTTLTFLVTRLSESAYDAFVERRRNKVIEV